MNPLGTIVDQNKLTNSKSSLQGSVRISCQQSGNALPEPADIDLTLNRDYKKSSFSLNCFLNEVLKSIRENFGVNDSIFKINNTSQRVCFRDLVRALFFEGNPFKKTNNEFDNVKNFLQIFTNPFCSIISNLNEQQKNLLKNLFSKGAFNEYRAKLALFYLKTANVIKDFIHVKRGSILDHEKMDFLILKKCKDPQASDELCALQVKSSEFKIQQFKGFHRKGRPRNISKSGIMAVNAGEKSLPDLARDIERELDNPKAKKLPVSQLPKDHSQWLDTVIRHFSPRSQPA
jgi:hypothetical protein